MNAGSLLATVNEYVGDSGTGSFTQSGGTQSVSSQLLLGNNAGSSGSYNLGGSGLLSVASNELIGWSGTGSFMQSGGTNSMMTGALSSGARPAAVDRIT